MERMDYTVTSCHLCVHLVLIEIFCLKAYLGSSLAVAKGEMLPAFQKLQVVVSNAPCKWYNKVKCTAFLKEVYHLSG